MTKLDDRLAHEIHFRKSRPADLVELHRLNVELQRFERRLRPSRRPARSLPRSYIADLLRRQRQKSASVWVAVAEDTIVGFVAFALRLDPLESSPPGVKLTDLVVTASWRRRGLGTSLIKVAEKFARTRRARRLTITTLVNNRPARRMYRALGFKQVYVTFERPLALRPTAQITKRKSTALR